MSEDLKLIKYKTKVFECSKCGMKVTYPYVNRRDWSFTILCPKCRGEMYVGGKTPKKKGPYNPSRR